MTQVEDKMDTFKLPATIEFDVPSWLVRGDSDLCEGRGPLIDLGHYFDDLAASAAARGKGAQGAPGYVSKSRAVRVTLSNGQVYSVDPQAFVPVSRDAVLEAKRAAALAKLTPEDIRVLGLSR